MSPVAEIQSRIADIESRIAAFAGANPYATPAAGVMGAATPTTGTTTGSASGAAFTDLLAASSTTVARAARATSGTPLGSSTSTGEALLAQAEEYLGTPYVWGGAQPGGFDCSGLIQYSAKQLGITLPRTAAQQAKVGTEVPSLDQARPGDLVVLSGGSHIGIYVGNGQMLHAPKTGDVVKISKVWETPLTIRRLGTTTATTAAAGTLAAAALLSGATGTSAASGADYVRPASLSATSKSAPYDAAFTAAEQKYGLPTGLLSAVAKQESGYDPSAKSPAGALGLMQFMPATARGMGIDPLDPAQAIDGAGKYLAQHLEAFGSVDLALAAYNAGPGNVRKYGGIPPFTETQNYVKKITATLGSTA